MSGARRIGLALALTGGGLALWALWPRPAPPPPPSRVAMVRSPLQVQVDTGTVPTATGSVASAPVQSALPTEAEASPKPDFPREFGGLFCPTEGVPSGTAGGLFSDAAPEVGMAAAVVEGLLYVPQLDELQGSGRVELIGYQPLQIQWMAAPGGGARCLLATLAFSPLASGIVGHVRNAEGLPEGRVQVWGCGVSTFTDEEGSFFLPAPPGPCTVLGRRQDGYWQSHSPPVDVVVLADQDVDVELILPEETKGGVGVSIGLDPLGVRVVAVNEGGAAWDAGLEAGSVILAVEGESVQGWGLDRFIDTVTGPTGTDVELTVLDPEGEEADVVLERRAMGPPAG